MAFENEGLVFVGHRNRQQALATRGPFYLDIGRVVLHVTVPAGKL